MKRRYWFSESWSRAAARLRVISGFLLVAIYAWFAEPTPVSLAYGLPIALGGLLLRGWAAGHLAKNERLVTSGPYAWVRNPLYLGTALVAAGLALAERRWEPAALFAALFLLVYLPVMEAEERHLRRLFPAYAEYAARVPMLWPRRCPTSAESFRWHLYRKNEEYQALLGFLLGAAWFIWRAW